MNILLKIAYDGTNYVGWQIQPNGISIQQVIQDKIKILTKEDVKLVGSGRTDSGVHAISQMANFHTNSTIPPNKFSVALNSILPQDIRIISSKRVKEDFNARFCAKEKTYVYNLYTGKENPLKSRYSTFVDFKLDIKKMQNACKILEGTHDFKCFLSSGSEVKDTVRTIYSLKVIKKGCDIKIKVCGNGFLYNMVRILSGTLLLVGQNKLTEKDLKVMLETKNRNLAGKTLKSSGLVLNSVKYK